VYLRNVYEQDGTFVIVDKSIEHEECPQYIRVIRGEINYQIIRIERHENTVKVLIETEITNGGFSSLE